jgi:hypothetical protein
MIYISTWYIMIYKPTHTLSIAKQWDPKSGVMLALPMAVRFYKACFEIVAAGVSNHLIHIYIYVHPYKLIKQKKLSRT